MRTPSTVSLVFLACAASAVAQGAPWATDLYLSGGGHFAQRVPVTVRNDGATAVSLSVIGVPVGPGGAPLEGVSVREVRVCDPNGNELLYDITTADGGVRHDGALAAGDAVRFLASCEAGGEATCEVYYDNARAQLVPDFLVSGLVNGGAEAGHDAPAGWMSAETDVQHAVGWVTEDPHSGTRCLKATVEAGAAPSWVKWHQTRIPVASGHRYALHAWVRAENVVGSAGWFIHVNGAQPQMINQVFDAGSGTFGWREVTYEFVAPEGAGDATIGTVLRGTGTAWFDDLSFEDVSRPEGVSVTVGPTESCRLARATVPEAWVLDADDWPFRAVVWARNLDTDARADIVVVAPLVRERIRLRGRAGGALRVIDTSGAEVEHCTIGPSVLFTASLPARSETPFLVYFGRDAAEGAADRSMAAALIDSPANIVKQAGFEVEVGLPAEWTVSSESPDGRTLCEPSIVEGGLLGERCAQLRVPADAPLAWAGWHQTVPVRPGASYLYMGYIRGEGLDGSAMLHGHILDAKGALVTLGPFMSTSPAISDAADWTLTSARVAMPSDAARFELHLTVNAHGTVWHDGILVCEVADASVEGLTAAREQRQPEGLLVWRADPVIKVFPDELYDPAAAGPASVVMARNEREPVQLVVRSGEDVAGARVSVSGPRLPSGETLPDVRIEWVGYVPVDYPSGYYSSRLGQGYRLRPSGTPIADGWAGEWPDPLIPDLPMDLAAGRAQPLWLTISAPGDATPGVYEALVTIQAGSEKREVPLSIEVLDLTLPEETHLRAIYDLRRGPGMDIHGDQDAKTSLKQWYRFLAERRVCPDTVQPGPVFGYRDGHVVMDTTEFDEMAELCFDELKMGHLYTPWEFYALGWAYPPKAMFGFEAFTPEYNAAFQEAYRMFMDHLRERGWLDKVVYYVSDEPHTSVPGVVENLRKVADLAHEAVPEAPIYSSTWTFDKGLVGALDIWGTGIHGSFPVAEMERRLADGDILWFTTDGHMCIDTPYCAVERLLPYYAMKYNHQAYEFWGVSWWTYNPWERGWHWFISQSDQGKDFYFVRYPNGDGYLAYPGETIGVAGPVSTIRLEEARDGLEEYEYMVILKERLAKAADGPAKTRGQAALDGALGLCRIPNKGGENSTDLLPEPGRLAAVREALLRAANGLRP